MSAIMQSAAPRERVQHIETYSAAVSLAVLPAGTG